MTEKTVTEMQKNLSEAREALQELLTAIEDLHKPRPMNTGAFTMKIPSDEQVRYEAALAKVNTVFAQFEDDPIQRLP